MRSLMNSGAKVRLYGMKLISLTPSMGRRVPGLCLWSTIHRRYRFSSNLTDSLCCCMLHLLIYCRLMSSAFWGYVYLLFQALKHNGTLYAHVFFARAGYPADPNDPEYLPLAAFGRTHGKMMAPSTFTDFPF